VKLPLLKELIEGSAAFDFKLEQASNVQAEYEKAVSVQARAETALDGPEKLSVPALKSLIVEGDKCKVQIDEIKALKKHLTAGQKWLGRFQKAQEMEAGDVDQLTEMKQLAEEAKDLRVAFSEEMPVVMHIITRCCLCRGFLEGSLVACSHCDEKFHTKCLHLEDAKTDEFVCVRCLVRRQFTKAVDMLLNILTRWSKGVPGDDDAGDDGDGYNGMNHLYPPYGPYVSKKQKCRALMKRAVQALRVCTQGGPEEIKRLAKGVKGQPLPEVCRLVMTDDGDELVDQDLGSFTDARALVQHFHRIIWASKLLYQLRRRPARNALDELIQAMSKLLIVDPPLSNALNQLYQRASQWVAKLKDLVRRGRLDEDNGLDVDGVRRLLDEKKYIPVMVKEEGRVLTVLADSGNRYCHCKGFYDGSNMVQCSGCETWFHSHCIGVRKDVASKTNYNYTCVNCCKKKGNKYSHPEYRPPEDELFGDGEMDDDEEGVLAGTKGETAELVGADTQSLVDLWPSVDILRELEEAMADVDSSSSVFKKRAGSGGMKGFKDKYKTLPPPQYRVGPPGHEPWAYRGPASEGSPAWSSSHRYSSDDDRLLSGSYQRMLMGSSDYKLPSRSSHPKPQPKKRQHKYSDDEDGDDGMQEEGMPEWEQPSQPATKKTKRVPKPSARLLESQMQYDGDMSSLSRVRNRVEEVEAQLLSGFSSAGLERPGQKENKPGRRTDSGSSSSSELLRGAEDGPSPRGGPPDRSSAHYSRHPPHLPPHPSKLYPFTIPEVTRYPGALMDPGAYGVSAFNHRLPPPPPPPQSAYARGGGSMRYGGDPGYSYHRPLAHGGSRGGKARARRGSDDDGSGDEAVR